MNNKQEIYSRNKGNRQDNKHKEDLSIGSKHATEDSKIFDNPQS